MTETFDVLGVPVSVTNLAAAEAQLVAWAADRKGRIVTAPDVSNVVRAQDEPELLATHRQASLVVPDGTPLVWIGKLRGKPVERTCGPDLMERVVAGSGRSGLKSYFYGGKDGVAERLKAAFEARFPDARIVGVGTPPFRPLTDGEIDALVGDIERSGADLVWIGISTPKQEALMARLVSRVPVTLLGVGAAFDFHTGDVRRAPKWAQRTGLEWAYRLFSEPRRLWRRYLVMAPRFVWLVARQALTGRT